MLIMLILLIVIRVFVVIDVAGLVACTEFKFRTFFF